MKNTLKIYLTATMLFMICNANAQTMKSVDNSLNAGKVSWLSQQINAGKVPFGIPVSREFEVKNISTESLMILQVKSSCHCTVTEWSKEPVEPGKSTKIKVTYDAEREGDFYRIVTVLTNFDTNQSVPLALTGKVEPKIEISSSN
jgi:Protein of unknown function (DUF1573)